MGYGPCQLPSLELQSMQGLCKEISKMWPHFPAVHFYRQWPFKSGLNIGTNRKKRYFSSQILMQIGFKHKFHRWTWAVNLYHRFLPIILNDQYKLRIQYSKVPFKNHPNISTYPGKCQYIYNNYIIIHQYINSYQYGIYIWVNYKNSVTWNKAHTWETILTNHHSSDVTDVTVRSL